MQISGEVISESFACYGNRQVSVFVPSNPVEAFVYCGDGQR